MYNRRQNTIVTVRTMAFEEASAMEPRFPILPQCPGTQKPVILQNNLLDRQLLKWEEFRSLACPWIRRAEEAGKAGNHFEALLHLWIPFNAWLAQVVRNRTCTENDRYLVDAAGRDKSMAERFVSLISHDTTFTELVTCFHKLWPVFKVRTLDELGLEPWSGNESERHDYRTKCFSIGLGPIDYAPACARDHQPDQNDFRNFSVCNIPLDWAHTLSTIYKARCNLFHGGKNFANSGDQLFVALAYPILWRMWAAPECGAQRMTASGVLYKK